MASLLSGDCIGWSCMSKSRFAGRPSSATGIGNVHTSLRALRTQPFHRHHSCQLGKHGHVVLLCMRLTEAGVRMVSKWPLDSLAKYLHRWATAACSGVGLFQRPQYAAASQQILDVRRCVASSQYRGFAWCTFPGAEHCHPWMTTNAVAGDIGLFNLLSGC